MEEGVDVKTYRWCLIHEQVDRFTEKREHCYEKAHGSRRPTADCIMVDVVLPVLS